MEVVQINKDVLDLYIDKATRDLSEALKSIFEDRGTMCFPERTINYHLQTLKQTIIKG